MDQDSERPDLPRPRWDPTMNISNGGVSIDDIRISFKRTIRVPDNKQVSNLPPDLGNFPLKYISDYDGTAPDLMVAKGGIFFPMYQREAMWIEFSSTSPYAIKIYVGGVNAISGEPAIETEDTQRRRAQLLRAGRSIQDYVIVPQQPWLDGIAKAPGNVRQFVAMPMGRGYTVEAQVTGEELTGGIQLEIIPTRSDLLKVIIQEEHCEPSAKVVWSTQFVRAVEAELVLAKGDYLIANGRVLPSIRRLEDTDVTDGTVIEVVRRVQPSDGFSERQRDVPISVYILRASTDTETIMISPDDTINDLKHIVQSRTSHAAHELKIYRPPSTQGNLGYPLDGRIKAQAAFTSPQHAGPFVITAPRINDGRVNITVIALTGKQFRLICYDTDTILKLMEMIESCEGIPVDQQRLIFAGKQLDSERTISNYNIRNKDRLHLVLRLRGGGGGDCGPAKRHVPAGMEMGIAVGGLIKQTIIRDDGKHEFDASQAKIFNVQILNSQHYRHVTGEEPPPSPISVKDYKDYGYPFFRMYEEPSIVAGSFNQVKSVKQLDGDEDEHCKPRTVHLDNAGLQWQAKRDTPKTRKFFDTTVPATPFRSVKELELAIRPKPSMDS